MKNKPAKKPATRSRAKPQRHLYRFDSDIRKKGYSFIGGVDEAGRGPLAGPVVAAAVILPEGVTFDGLNDSKCVKPERREALFDQIMDQAVSAGVGIVDSEEIDRINILQATLLAARQALNQLDPAPDYLVTDFLKLSDLEYPVEAIVDGDARSASVAAASILAKVTRDRLMQEYDLEYPGYDFASHKGYSCPRHCEALNDLGPTSIHRLTFKGVVFFDEESRHSRTFARLRDEIERANTKESLEQLKQAIEHPGCRLPASETKTLQQFLAEKLSSTHTAAKDQDAAALG